MTEFVFKDITGFPGYRVGTDGSVWSKRLAIRGERMGDDWHRLNPVLRRGYPRAGLRKNNKVHWVSVHKLVLEAFVGPCPDGMEACHFPDHDRSNNARANLRWDSRPANAVDSVLMGRTIKGSAHRDAKLTESDVPEIKTLVEAGKSHRAIGKMYGVTHAAIGALVRGHTWKHV